jgi:hypothetical protein
MKKFPNAPCQPSRWLCNLTCNWQGELSREYGDGKYWLMKHTGHTTYIDRVCGSAYCGTYWMLYKVEDINVSDFGYGSMMKDSVGVVWTADGRWLKKYEQQIRDIIEK